MRSACQWPEIRNADTRTRARVNERTTMMKLDKILNEVFSCGCDPLADETELRLLDSWDSMTHMILITRAENEFAFQMTGDEIASIETVGDLRRIVGGAATEG